MANKNHHPTFLNRIFHAKVLLPLTTAIETSESELRLLIVFDLSIELFLRLITATV